MKARTALGPLLLLSLSLLSGCGGAGIGFQSPIANNPQGGGSGPGGDDGKRRMDEGFRIATMKKIQDKIQSYTTTTVPIAQRNAEMVAYIKTLPGIANAGVGADGSILTRFVDNRYYLLADNLQLPPAPGKNRGSALRSGNRASQPRMGGALAAAAAVDLPLNNKALLLNALGSDLNPPGSDIQEKLVERGYSVTMLDATVENLRAVSDVGVMHFSTHGAQATSFGDPNKKFWSVWTSSVVSPENSTKYLNDLQAGRLVYFSAVNGYDFVVKQRWEMHYAITADFIKYYNWTFSEGAIAFINCCWSDKSGITATLRSLPKPAKATLGWTNAAGVEPAWDSARFFFDRMLGINDEAPSEPGQQRPFNVQGVFNDMKRKNLAQANTGQYGPCDLVAVGDGILAPSIKTMRVLERGYEDPVPLTKPKLILEGWFGSRQPQVTVGGVPVVQVLSWSPTKIECEVVEKPGAGYSGLVQVIGANGIGGNKVPLTHYSSVFKYTGNPMTTSVATASTLTYTVTWRADVHSYREECGGPLIKPEKRPFRASVGSKCDWTMNPPPPGAAWVYNGSTMTFGLKGNRNPPFGSGYVFEGWMNVSGGLVPLAVSFLDGVSKYTMPGVSQVFDLATPRDTNILGTPQQVADEQGTAVFAPSFTAVLNPDYSIGAGTRTGAMTATHATKIQWSAISPVNRPTTDEQEDVEP